MSGNAWDSILKVPTTTKFPSPTSLRSPRPILHTRLPPPRPLPVPSTHRADIQRCRARPRGYIMSMHLCLLNYVEDTYNCTTYASLYSDRSRRVFEATPFLYSPSTRRRRRFYGLGSAFVCPHRLPTPAFRQTECPPDSSRVPYSSGFHFGNDEVRCNLAHFSDFHHHPAITFVAPLGNYGYVLPYRRILFCYYSHPFVVCLT